MKKKKAQAAIEFLTTYSWAIMVILLTIGALTYFDIFNTTRFISERCETGNQIRCVEATVSTGGEFKMRVTNNYPVTIDITGFTIKQGNSEFSGGQHPGISPGETVELSAVTDTEYSPRSREMFNIEITFKRTEGNNEYTINGNAVVRPV